MKATSQQKRLIMVVIAVVLGLFMIAAAPFIVQTSLERVLKEILVAIQEEPKFTSGLGLFNLFYPIWRALIFVAGITLLVISTAIYKGEEWTYPVMMSAYALPAIGGMFMFLPYISFVGGFPLPMVISWVGLAGYWSTIFLRDREVKEKWVTLAVLTFIGMLATHAFVIGIGAQRMLWTRPGHPLYAGLEWWILTLSGEVNWMGTTLLIISIPLLTMRKKAGWWMAVIAAISILAIDAPTQIIRTKTLDYLYGSLLAIGLLFFTLLPSFKKVLIDEEVQNELED